MPIHITLLGFLLISSLSLVFSDAPTAYQMLERYNFPKGILPEGVQSYLLRKDGGFEVYLGDDCEFKVQGNYLLRYKRRITGMVESGALKNLKGVSVKVLFVWFGINEVVRSDEELRFYVGPLSATFSLANFMDCPKCRCGFDCASDLVAKA